MAQVLLVEQDAILRAQYEHVLSSSLCITAIESAQLAIDILDDKSISVDGIVTDVNLGRNNGIELLHELRSYDDWLHIPVVLLSSVPQSRFRHINFCRYGVRDFIYKPMTSPHNVLRRVKLALQDHETYTD